MGGGGGVNVDIAPRSMVPSSVIMELVRFLRVFATTFCFQMPIFDRSTTFYRLRFVLRAHGLQSVLVEG